MEKFILSAMMQTEPSYMYLPAPYTWIKRKPKLLRKPFPRALTAIRISTIMRSYTVDTIQQNKFRSFLDDYKDKGGIIVILPLFY